MLQLIFRFRILKIIFLITSYTSILSAQQQADLSRTVFLDATIDTENSSITLQWDVFEGTTSYFIFQRLQGSETWGPEIATLDGATNQFTIENIDHNVLYEFRVFRLNVSGSANGYLTCGIEVEQNIFGRHLILVCTDLIEENLSTELEEYISILSQEGYIVSKLITPIEASITDVKTKIIDAKNAVGIDQTSIFLLGNVPVPYSGNIVPDGHSNHVGAWPCDGYYGELDGVWTDETVTNESAQHTRTHNIPGDGKFDQNTFPDPVDLAVGRADFSRMPLFEDDEVELTRRYLKKDIGFRTGIIQANRQGIVENNFSLTEGFGQNGYKNIAALLGRSNVLSKDYSCLSTENYMWSFGAGGGNYQGAGGIGNTTGFAADSLQTIFTMLFGSYFGDWDISNNFLRSAIATGTTLTNTWAGRPHWYFHPMGMGADIGECTLLSMNNTSYDAGFAARGVHMALMGDPTLKMDYINPLVKLDIAEDNGHVMLEWNTDELDTFQRYYVYRSEALNQPELIGTTQNLSYVDSCLVFEETYQYYVTAAKLHLGASGSYFIQSRYLTDSLTIQTDLSLEPSFDVLNQYNLTVELANTTAEIDSLLWEFGDGTSSTELEPIHVFKNPGTYTICLTVYTACEAYKTTEAVSIETSNTKGYLEEQFEIFPIPSNDWFSLKVPEHLYPIDIDILNQISEKVFQMESIENNQLIDISNLPSGNYLVKIKSGNRQQKTTITKRLVVLKN